MFKNKIKIILWVCTLVLVFCTQSVNAQETYTNDERIAILTTPAIACETPGQKYSRELEVQYLNMSDSEFEKNLKESLENIIDRRNNGEKIKWNKKFVDTTIKTLFLDLYVKIQNQIISEDNLVRTNNQVAPSDVGIMGGKTVTFPIIAENFAGVDIYGFFCEMTWYWDSTKITSVVPSTYGECYMIGYSYEGLTQNKGYFQNNSTSYYKYVKGHFVRSLDGLIISNHYPWHEIIVYKGGTYDWDWDY